MNDEESAHDSFKVKERSSKDDQAKFFFCLHRMGFNKC